MKIGILTFHRAENFGAVLQTYALQTFLELQGNEVYIIDYRCPAIESAYHIFNPSILWSRKNILITFKEYFIRLVSSRERWRKKKVYSRFRNQYLHLTSPLREITSDLGFDAYVVGSDQVWNLHITNGVDPHYFLDFPMRSSAIRIAYAASSEYDPVGLMARYELKISSLLSRFNAISVRESFLQKEIQLYTEKRVMQCVDPTCLLSKHDYEMLAIRPRLKEYILVYQMHPMPEGLKLANRLAVEHHCKVVVIRGGVSAIKRRNELQSMDPREILGWMLNAKTIITSSFHGLTLSILLEKDVWVMDVENNLRQKNMLNMAGLSHRMISMSSEYNESTIDYDAVSRNLEQPIQESKAFLRAALTLNE